MAAGFPTKSNWATGDVLTAAQMNDLAGTVNLNAPTAKGSIKAGSAANTLTDIAVGADGTVLTADAASTGGVKWATVAAGGMTLLSTTTLSGATTTISSISGSYKDLEIWIYGYTAASGPLYPAVAPNATANCAISYTYDDNGTASSYAQEAAYMRLSPSSAGILHSSSNNCYVLKIMNYASTSNYKPVFGSHYAIKNTGSTILSGQFGGAIATNSAITSIDITSNGGNWSTGTVKIYGVN